MTDNPSQRQRRTYETTTLARVIRGEGVHRVDITLREQTGDHASGDRLVLRAGFRGDRTGPSIWLSPDDAERFGLAMVEAARRLQGRTP